MACRRKAVASALLFGGLALPALPPRHRQPGRATASTRSSASLFTLPLAGLLAEPGPARPARRRARDARGRRRRRLRGRAGPAHRPRLGRRGPGGAVRRRARPARRPLPHRRRLALHPPPVRGRQGPRPVGRRRHLPPRPPAGGPARSAATTGSSRPRAPGSGRRPCAGGSRPAGRSGASSPQRAGHQPGARPAASSPGPGHVRGLPQHPPPARPPARTAGVPRAPAAGGPGAAERALPAPAARASSRRFALWLPFADRAREPATRCGSPCRSWPRTSCSRSRCSSRSSTTGPARLRATGSSPRAASRTSPSSCPTVGRDDRARAPHDRVRPAPGLARRSGCSSSSATTRDSDLMRALAHQLAAAHAPARIQYLRPPRRGTPGAQGGRQGGQPQRGAGPPRRARARHRLHRDARRRRPRGRPPLPAPLRRSARGGPGGRLRADGQGGVVSRGDPFDNLQPHFFRGSMLARHAANAVFPCGSGLVWRRTALEDIGGFPTWNLVEDLQSGVEALAGAGAGVYLPIRGAVGQHAPEDLPNAYKQRGTWAVDTIRLLLWGDLRGLSLRQRLHFAELGLFYLQSFATLVFLACPVLGLATGLYPLQTSYGGLRAAFLALRGRDRAPARRPRRGSALRGALAGAAAVGRPRARLRAGLRPRRPRWPEPQARLPRDAQARRAPLALARVRCPSSCC